MPTVQIHGATHYHEIHGTGTPVLLLHGGFCSLEVMRPQLDSLKLYTKVHAPERPGHGRTADVDGPMTYARSVADTLAYMDAVGLDDAHIVGFSDGAIIGLLIALDQPSRIRSLVAISANLDPSGFVGSEELSPDRDEAEDEPAADQPNSYQPAAPHHVDSTEAEEADRETHNIYRDHYAALSPDPPGHLEVVLEKLHHMWTHEPNIDPSRLDEIRVPCLVMAGDRDVIRPEHTRLISASIPRGQLCIVPDAGHDLMEARPSLVNFVVEEFISVISDEQAAR